MLEVKGDFEKLKEEMKFHLTDLKSEIKMYKNIYKKNEKEGMAADIRRRLSEKIDGLIELQRFYMVSKTLPARMNNLTINYKLLESFLKKIKGFESEISFQEDSLYLEYWKFGSKSKGTLILKDISGYYVDFPHIPIAEVVNE